MGLKAKGVTSQKELQYFIYELKMLTNLGKLYFFPKIHKRLLLCLESQ